MVSGIMFNTGGNVMLRKPKVCIEERCGASCDMTIVDMMSSLYRGDPHKCPAYIRDDLLYEKSKQKKAEKKIYKKALQIIENEIKQDRPPEFKLDNLKRIFEDLSH